MTPEMAELSRTIDPSELGRRIRNVRVAAGMTQSDVAGDEVTTAYISRIEDGQRRPSAALFEQMAARLKTTPEELLLGVSIDEQMELRVKLDHAELALASGDAQAALKAAKALQTELADKSLGDLKRGASQVLAFALEATGDLQRAIAVLEELTAEPRADSAWLKALIGLSRCYRDSGDLNRAIAVGEQATEMIEKLGIDGMTEAIQLTLTVAGAYMVRGDTDYAMRVCQRAIAAAERYDSPIARASAYWNASFLEAKKGAHSSALDLAQKALVLYEVGEDARNLGRLRAQVANLQLATDPPDAEGALRTLADAEREMAWSSVGPVDLARENLTRSRAHFLLGHNEEATAALRKARELAPDNTPTLNASIAVLEGEIAATNGNPDVARENYRRAVQILTAIGADREAAQLWFELGNLLSDVGDAEGALDAFKRAGASSGLIAGSALASRASRSIPAT